MNLFENEFLKKLNYFGGRIVITDNIDFTKTYIDLELFFVESTLFANLDSRVCRCLEHWVERFGILLSPSKVRRILKKREPKTGYDPSILGVWVERIVRNVRNQNNWSIVKKYTKRKARKEFLFKNNPKPKNPDPIFFKFNLLAPRFQEESAKYIQNMDYLLKHCVEINSRITHRNQVVSDLLAVKTKTPNLSLYRIAKLIHSDISRVVKEFNFYRYFGIAA